MPYIDTTKRIALDKHINKLVQELCSLEKDEPNNTEGNINYVFSRILYQFYHSGYKNINNAMGILNSVTHEYYRKVAVPYEDEKCKDNGEVFE